MNWDEDEEGENELNKKFNLVIKENEILKTKLKVIFGLHQINIIKKEEEEEKKEEEMF